MKTTIIAIQQAVGTTPDGIPGPKTLHAIATALKCAATWGSVQHAVGVVTDGIAGPKTWAAIASRLGIVLPVGADYPDDNDQALRAYYGSPGENLVTVDLPYPMRLAWEEEETIVTRATFNKRCVQSFLNLLRKTLDHYGLDRIRELGLDLFGGSYTKRKITGGNRWSTHAYGCAMDIDPDHNELNWSSACARLAQPEYAPFWQFVREEGLEGLGPAKDFDWMHIQACHRR